MASRTGARAGDTVILTRVDAAHAGESPAPRPSGDLRWAGVVGGRPGAPSAPMLGAPERRVRRAGELRRAGERGLLVEFGDPVLDLRLRVRAHLLQQALLAADLNGVIDMTPGVRSLHIHHDPDTLPGALLDALAALEAGLEPPDALLHRRSTVYLPLAWRHPATLAVERYIRRRPRGCPVVPGQHRVHPSHQRPRQRRRRATDRLRRRYLVLGLGDVYLGAPVAMPLDPRHRLVTTKYNPARTWTPENAVGIGGAYLCIYGMEGPGGYQFVGRTVQVWHCRGPTRPRRGCCATFDQLRFVPVRAEELFEQRARCAPARGTSSSRIEPVAFSLAAGDARSQASTPTRSRRSATRRQGSGEAGRNR